MKLHSFSLSLVVGFACLGFSDQTLAASVDSGLATDSLAQHESQSRPTTYESRELRNHSTERELDHSLNPFPRDAVESISKLGTEIEQRRAVRDHISIYDEESTVLFLDAITSIENREVRETLLDMTFMSLAEIDPPKTMDFFNGLKLEYQDIVIEAIFSKVSLSDLEDCLKHIQHLDRYQEERAVLAFLNSTENLDYESLIDIAKLSIYAATPFIAEIKDGKQQFELADEITEHWTKQDLNATSEMITNYHHLTRDDFMLTSMTRILAKESPREAVNIVGKYFGEYGADMEIRIFETIFEHQPNEGLLLLSQVRHELLDWQVTRFAGIIFRISPEQAVDFGDTVPEQEKEDYFESLKRNFCHSEANILVPLIDRIPLPKIASESAACLISNAIHEGKYMTQDEYNVLFKYLLKDELKWIEKYDIWSFLSD